MVGLLAIEQVLQAVGEVTARVGRGAGLRGKEWQLIAWLAERYQCTGSELAQLTCRRRQEVHRTLQSLAGPGSRLVERIPSPSPREVLWQLTEAGSYRAMLIKDESRQLDYLINEEFRDDLPRLFAWLERLRDVTRNGRVTSQNFAFSPPPPRFRMPEIDH